METSTIAPTTGDTEAYYRAIIGPKRTEYYLRYFARRDAGGGFLSWNWPCALVSFLWALYRKCWGFAFGSLLVAGVFAVVIGMIYIVVAGTMGGSREDIAQQAQWVSWLAGLVVGAFGNGFYHRKARRLIAATSHITDRDLRLQELARRGGTSRVWLVILIIPILGILAAIAIPAYQSYIKRTHGVEQRAGISAPAPTFSGS